MTQLPDFQRLVGRLRLRHLALLDSLGRDPNVGRAAKRLHMAQPTAGKLLREIEDAPGAVGRYAWTICRRACYRLFFQRAAQG